MKHIVVGSMGVFFSFATLAMAQNGPVSPSQAEALNECLRAKYRCGNAPSCSDAYFRCINSVDPVRYPLPFPRLSDELDETGE